jgi:hypothetical protein
VSAKPNPKPAGAAERAPYEKTPSSKDGEFPFHNVQVADLNAKTSTESRRTGDGVAAK